jgi:MotA/TolQ/ExbB proton channel family
MAHSDTRLAAWTAERNSAAEADVRPGVRDGRLTLFQEAIMTNSYSPAAGDFATTGGASLLAPARGGLPAWFGILCDSDGPTQRYLLLMRFTVFNLVAIALLGAAWLKGWVGFVMQADTTQLVLIISLVFAYGFVSCAHKVFATSVEINQARDPARYPGSRVARYLESIRGRDGHARALCASALKLKLGARIASIRHLANSLVLLGLIGTVIGFIIALSGVDAEAAADVSSIGPMVTILISGMSVALHTTLVGAVLNIWLMINYRLLEGGTVTLISTIVELGERDVRA